MDDTAAIQRIVAAIESAWDAGCPVAGVVSADREQMAQISLRRWNSFARRRKKGDKAEQVEDLAKGLRDAHQGKPEFVGPLMTDYRYLAFVISAALSAEE